MSLYLALLLHTGARIEWSSFTVHASTVIGLALFGALYGWRARQGLRAGETLTSGQASCFASGIVVMFLSLNGWLHDLSDTYLFSAHMVQHLVLTMAVAPLFIMGTPGWMLRPLLRAHWIAAVARAITRPWICAVTFIVVLGGWHLPIFYNAALAYHPLHIVEHLLMLASAVMMWWPVLSPLPELPRISYPLQMLYLFLLTIPMSIVAVWIAYSDHVLYPAYAVAPRIWGLSPLQDQLLGGLIMWVPGGLFMYVVISVIFFRWQQVGEDSRAGAQVRA